MEFLKAQMTRIPLIKSVNLSTCTVLITGGNAGLGLEAARQIMSSKPQRLILACRNVEKGEIAKEELASMKTSPATKIEVRQLDQNSFASVKSFVEGLKGEPVDIAILNAGVMNSSFQPTVDDLESDLQVNTLSPALLSLLLLPNLRLASKTQRLDGTPQPHLTFVGSGLHAMAKFPERKLPQGEILAKLNVREAYTQADRYPVAKTIGLFWMRELAHRVSPSEIIINSVNPGFCKTNIMGHATGASKYMSKLAQGLVGRSSEDGARCIVDGATLRGPDSHGKYLSEMQVKPESDIVKGPEGADLQGRLWDETYALFEKHGVEVPKV